jgi:hypothetical protein
MVIRRYSNDKVDVRIKYVFILFPAKILVLGSVMQPLEPEQAIMSRSLLEETNESVIGGKIECDQTSNHMRYLGTFDPLVSRQWCADAREQFQEFLIEYTLGVIPEILLDIFIRVTDPSRQIDRTTKLSL